MGCAINFAFQFERAGTESGKYQLGRWRRGRDRKKRLGTYGFSLLSPQTSGHGPDSSSQTCTGSMRALRNGLWQMVATDRWGICTRFAHQARDRPTRKPANRRGWTSFTGPAGSYDNKLPDEHNKFSSDRGRYGACTDLAGRM